MALTSPSLPLRASAAVCALALPLALAGCAPAGPASDVPAASEPAASATSLTAGLEPDRVTPTSELTEAQADALTDFSLTLFNEAGRAARCSHRSPSSTRWP